MDKTHIQKDWEQREVIETVSVNIKKIADFLNKFGKHPVKIKFLLK
jgi:hypothetical protein